MFERTTWKVQFRLEDVPNICTVEFMSFDEAYNFICQIMKRKGFSLIEFFLFTERAVPLPMDRFMYEPLD